MEPNTTLSGSGQSKATEVDAFAVPVRAGPSADQPVVTDTAVDSDFVAVNPNHTPPAKLPSSAFTGPGAAAAGSLDTPDIQPPVSDAVTVGKQAPASTSPRSVLATPPDGALQPAGMTANDAVMNQGSLLDGASPGTSDNNILLPPRPTSRRRLVGLGLLGFGVLAAILLGVRIELNKSQALNSSLNGAARFKLQSVALPSLDKELGSPGMANTVSALTVNGQVNVSNSLVLRPSSQPNNAVAGQLYYDNGGNRLEYFNGTSFVALQGGASVVNNYNATINGGGTAGINGTPGDIAAFASGQSLGNSLLNESASVLSVAGTLNLSNGNQYEIGGSQIASSDLADSNNLAKLDASQTFTGSTNFFRNSTDSATALQVQNAVGAQVLNVDTTKSELTVRGGAAATVGPELISITDFTNAAWTSANWTTTATTATHITGNNTWLNSNQFTAIAGDTYQVTFTVTGSPTAGQTITPCIGAVNGAAISGNVTNEVETIVAAGTTTPAICFVPTSNWGGTLSNVSVKQITASNPGLSVYDSTNSFSIDIRTSGVFGNTFVGSNSGQFDTIGNRNTGVGSGALGNNTTGQENAASGFNTLQFNTTGSQNAGYGRWALQLNVSGSHNSALGYAAGLSNTTGSYNTFVGSNANLDSSVSGKLQNATAIGADSVVAQNDSLILGCINGINGCTVSTSVGIGTSAPLATLDVRGNDLIKTNAVNALQVQNALGTPLLVADTSTMKLTVTNLVVSANLTVNGHIVTAGNTPAIVAGAAACTAPAVSIAGNDTSGTITITTGSSCAMAGDLAAISFSSAYGSVPHPTFTPIGSSAAGLNAYLDSSSLSAAGFSIGTASTPASSTTYKWEYWVAQ